MEVLSVLNLGDIAQIFSKMGMFPVFDLAYYIVSILYLKYEPGERTPSFYYCRELDYFMNMPLKSPLNHISKVTTI